MAQRRRYWADRKLGIPRPISRDEGLAMLEWLTSIPGLSAEVTELSSGIETAENGTRGFAEMLIDSRLQSEDPVTSLRMLVMVLGNQLRYYWGAEAAVEVARKAKSVGAPQPLIDSFCDEMLRLGFGDVDICS